MTTVVAAASMPASNPDFEIRLAKTESALANLGQDVKDLVDAMSKIAGKLDTDRVSFSEALSKRDKTNWALVVSIVGASMAGMAYIGSGWREPLVLRQDAIAASVDALQKAVVPRAEVAGYVSAMQRDGDLVRNRIERAEARIDKRLDRLEATVFVPAWTATARPRS